MSYAFKTNEKINSGDYIENKRNINNYLYFKKRLDNNKSKSRIISNYNGTVYYKKNNHKYKLAYSNSYRQLLSINKGAYINKGYILDKEGDIVYCQLSCNTAPNIYGNLDENRFTYANSIAEVYTIQTADKIHLDIYNPDYKTIPKNNQCHAYTYNKNIKNGNIQLKPYYTVEKYSLNDFKFPSALEYVTTLQMSLKQ